MWLPIESAHQDDFVEAPQLAHQVRVAQQAKAVAAMNRGEFEYANLNVALSGSLSAGLFSGSASANRVLAVMGLVVFDEVTMDGIRTRVGGGFRLTVGVSSVDADLDMSLPGIAAAAQLKMAEAYFRFSWAGLSLDVLGDTLAGVGVGPEPLSVANYAKAVAAMEAAKLKILSTRGAIDPTPMSTWVEDASYADWANVAAIARVAALSGIADNRSLDATLAAIPASATWKDAVSDAYIGLAPGAAPNPLPTAVTAAQARLGRYRLKT